MKITPTFDRVYKIVLVILSALASGSLYQPSFISAVVAKDIAGMSSGALLILTGVYNVLGTGAEPSITITGKTIALWLLAPLVAVKLILPAPAHAASKIKLPIPLPPLKPLSSIVSGATGANVTGKPLADLDSAYSAIQKLSLADLTAAKADADATKDIVSSPCYGALITMTTAQQSIDLTKLEGQPHLVLTFQRGHDLYNALRPGSAVSMACAPLAEQVKLDITTLIAQIAAGTLTMASFGL